MKGFLQAVFWFVIAAGIAKKVGGAEISSNDAIGTEATVCVSETQPPH